MLVRIGREQDALTWAPRQTSHELSPTPRRQDTGTLPGRVAPRPARPARPSPAGHLRSPARQARPPPEREARRCSLMASVGDRSHHGGGPISPRPAGSGSHGLWRCSVAAHERRELGWGRRPGRTGVSARQLRASGASGAHAGPAGEFPFPRARPAHHPHPDTCDHRQLPSAETGTSWKRTRTPASFPQSEPADGEADGQTARQGPGPADGARPRRRRTRAPPAPLPASCRLTRPSPLPRLHAVRMGRACPRGASRPGGAPSS